MTELSVLQRSIELRKFPGCWPGWWAVSASAILWCALGAGCGPTSLLITPVPSSRDVVEFELERESPFATAKLAVIDVDGVIRNARPSSFIGQPGENPLAEFKEKLDRAADDSAVRGVIVRINSPGGGVTASDIMYSELRRFRERSGKPVYAAFMDVAASGGYYIACATDKIYAHPTTITGSIGVISILPDLTGTMGKLGIRTNVIKSDTFKDAGSPFRQMTDADRAIFEEMTARMYARFLEVVGSSRKNLTAEQIRKLADGRVYHATQALENGLVDQIGTLEQVTQDLRVASGIGDRSLVLVSYARPTAHRPNIYAEAPGAAQINVLNVDLPEWLTSGTPQFMYLWAPGL